MRATGTVLEQSAQTAATASRAMSPVCRCLNCGEPFQRGAREAEFCGRICVRAWNNRRLVRGAELYDLIMIARFERAAATKFKVWRAINRLAAKFRDEDKAQRGGRRSWRRLRSIIETKIFLWAE